MVSYEARLEVQNPDGLLRPGMTATATIATQNTGSALLVPNAALRFRPDAKDEGGGGGVFQPQIGLEDQKQQATIGEGSRQQVQVLQADGTLKAIEVVTGRSDGRRTVVTSTQLKPGMKVDGFAFTQFDGTVFWDRLAISHRIDEAKDIQWSFKLWSEKKQGSRVAELPGDLQTLVRGKKAAEWSVPERKRLLDWWLENEFQGGREQLDGLRAANGVGMGRELFANMRRNALSAEEGACSWL